MNILKGKVAKIKKENSLSVIKVDIKGFMFWAMVIENASTTFLQIGSPVRLLFKETAVIIGKGLNHPISVENKIAGKILDIEEGKVLSKIVLHTYIGHITAMINTETFHQLQLKLEDEVTALILTTEIMLGK